MVKDFFTNEMEAEGPLCKNITQIAQYCWENTM